MSLPTLETFKLALQPNGVLLLTFSAPSGNAMSPQLFKDWLTAIRFAASTDSVKVVVQTGSGKFYSSGKDLRDTKQATFEREMNADMDVLETLIDHLIDFPKPLLAAVNGPAIGFGATSLAHFDFIFAVPSASLLVPFMRWGFCAEGCSSLLFPRLLGRQLANELLLMGSTVHARQLETQGCLQILPQEDFLQSVLKRADTLASYNTHTVKVTRDLVASRSRQELKDVNHKGLSTLRRLMMLDASRQAIQTFVDERRKKQSERKAKI